VVYRHRVTGEIIIAGIRGDLEVNKNKLEHAIDAVGQLVEASDDDLVKIGTKRGYVHSWGHQGVKYVGDLSLKTVRNFIGGQKEDTTDSRNVNYDRDFTCDLLADIAEAKEGDWSEDGSQILREKRGIEVGNIFQLGYHYTKKMKDATFVDNDGKLKPYYMGCYGIGLGRTLATIVGQYHDEKGIRWPKQVAPFQAHLVTIGVEGEQIYEKFLEAGMEVLWDDREESPGKKFADADLIGIPVRLVVSERTQGKIEWKERDKKETELMTIEEIINRFKN
jgi:prolyl-tRNA synthetase